MVVFNGRLSPLNLPEGPLILQADGLLLGDIGRLHGSPESYSVTPGLEEMRSVVLIGGLVSWDGPHDGGLEVPWRQIPPIPIPQGCRC